MTPFMIKMMKILFTRFPLASAYGGAEIQTLSLMKGLMERGHAVAFGGSCPVLLELCKKEGIPAAALDIGVPPVTKTGALTFAWRKARMKRQLKRFLDQFHDIDVVCMLSLSEKLLLTDEAHDRNIKVVWIEHDRVGRWLEKNPWLKLLLSQSAHATTVTVSDLSRKMYLDLGWDPNKTVAIANGIDASRLSSAHPINQSTNQPINRIHIGCIARLSPDKGIDLLIESIKDIPDAHLEIVGEGGEKYGLKRLTQKLGLEDHVTFTKPQENVADLYARFDALVLPSREHDPFGLVAAEAMMSGVATIVTDACGIAGYLENGKDSLIVKANSAEALGEAIITLSNGSARAAIAKRGEKTARERFSLKKMIDEYEKTLRM